MKTKRILIADDDERFLRIVEFLLKKKKHEVVPARDGKEALEKIRECSPDLILLDIKMPIIDGFHVLKYLKGDENTKDIPVIILSAMSLSKDVLKGLKMGATDYIVKPFSIDELFIRINKILKQ